MTHTARRWLWSLLVSAGCSTATLAATPPATPSATPPANDAVRALPELRVGTSADYAPFSTRDAAGKPQGFDVEIAEQLARDLGVELHWVPFRWPELAQKLSAGDFDLAMGGVSWQPARGVTGYLTRSVARGGPCVLGNAAAERVAVNHGGVLEAWARGHFPNRELVTVEDNLSLPGLLAAGQVGAIVTDSFELASFERPGWAVACEPALTRKVYWVGPKRAADLGTRIDTWLSAHGAQVQTAQEHWFGKRQRFDAVTHLVDLMARRFAFMPLVAALKAEQHLPIEDLAREREVLAGVSAGAARRGLPEAPVRELFALQIELSKAVERRQSEATALDFKTQVRPALTELGNRILDALVEARSAQQLSALTSTDLELLSPWLNATEREQVLVRLHALAAA